MEHLLQAPAQPLFTEPVDVLIVDDDVHISRFLKRLLESQGHTCTVANSAEEARSVLAERSFAILLCDVNMPGESGLDLVRDILLHHPETAALMVTGLDSPPLAQSAMEAGAYGYIIKPFKSNEILIAVANALRRRKLEIENRFHRENLEAMVRARTAALQQTLDWLERSQHDLRLSHEETIHRLAIAAEYRDRCTARHIQRMSQYCALLARLCGLSPERCDLIRTASPMHDIGKIGTPDNVLLKPGKFTPEEFDVIAQHPEIGYRILNGSDSPLLKIAATIAWTHHERFDGSGYPRGLVGSTIPLEGRIAAIGDAFDALTTQRVYKPAYDIDHAFALMREHRATHFDPELLDLFLAAEQDLLQIREEYPDE